MLGEFFLWNKNIEKFISSLKSSRLDFKIQLDVIFILIYSLTLMKILIIQMKINFSHYVVLYFLHELRKSSFIIKPHHKTDFQSTNFIKFRTSQFIHCFMAEFFGVLFFKHCHCQQKPLEYKKIINFKKSVSHTIQAQLQWEKENCQKV